MGFIKKVKMIDSATGMEISKGTYKGEPINADPLRHKKLKCRMCGGVVKRKGKAKGDLKQQHFKCRMHGTLSENDVIVFG